MRKILLSLLLASAATAPATAGPRHFSDQQTQENAQPSRDEHQQVREERQQARQESRADRSADRPSFNVRSVDAPQQHLQAPSREIVHNSNVEQFHGGRDAGRLSVQGARVQRLNQSSDRGNVAMRDQHTSSDDVAPGPRMVIAPGAPDVRGGRRVTIESKRGTARVPESRDTDAPRMVQVGQDLHERVESRDLRQSSRTLPNVMHSRNPLVVSDVPRRGTQPPLRTEARKHPQIQWSTNWRNNHRYDWHNYRHHHRSHFHLGFYFDPFGWGYQPYSIGWRLWPAYYSSRYWIHDPWSYRLPYAPPGYEWVRYWNDALLVDTWTGEVVDVIPNFFW